MKTSFTLTVNSDVVMIMDGFGVMDSMEIESLILSSSWQVQGAEGGILFYDFITATSNSAINSNTGQYLGNKQLLTDCSSVMQGMEASRQRKVCLYLAQYTSLVYYQINNQAGGKEVRPLGVLAGGH